MPSDSDENKRRYFWKAYGPSVEFAKNAHLRKGDFLFHEKSGTLVAIASVTSNKFTTYKRKSGWRKGKSVWFWKTKVEKDLEEVQLNYDQLKEEATKKKILIPGTGRGQSGYRELSGTFAKFLFKKAGFSVGHTSAKNSPHGKGSSKITAKTSPAEENDSVSGIEGVPVERFGFGRTKDKKLRAACIAKHGYRCVCCKKTLEEIYGKIAKDFIHVHHLGPLSTYGHGRVISAEKDLVPICPNCHTIIHLGPKLHKPKQVTAYLLAARKRKN